MRPVRFASRATASRMTTAMHDPTLRVTAHETRRAFEAGLFDVAIARLAYGAPAPPCMSDRRGGRGSFRTTLRSDGTAPAAVRRSPTRCGSFCIPAPIGSCGRCAMPFPTARLALPNPQNPAQGALARFGKAAYTVVRGDVIPSSCH